MSRPTRAATARNVATIARREYTWRGRAGRSRSRPSSSSSSPSVSRWPRSSSRRSAGARLPTGSPSTRVRLRRRSTSPAPLESLLDATASASVPGSGQPAPAGFDVAAVTDPPAARAEVERGEVKAAIALSRTSSGDLAYHVYSKLAAFERTSQLIEAAVTTLTIQDRLARAGIAPGDQARLFSPAAIDFELPPSASAGRVDPRPAHRWLDPGGGPHDRDLHRDHGLRQRVAMSVVEEKSSRVMEIILGAARPVELLTGKVLGVGGLALTQYAIVFIPVALAVLFEGAIAALVLGGNATVELPKGLSVSLLVGFGIFFVLGFLLYATLYAGVASLVSRQEDVNQIIGPLTLISTLGQPRRAPDQLGPDRARLAARPESRPTSRSSARYHGLEDGHRAGRAVGAGDLTGHPGALDRARPVGLRPGLCGRRPDVRAEARGADLHPGVLRNG